MKQKQLTSDYIVNECVRYILENPIEDFVCITLPNGTNVRIHKGYRWPTELAFAKRYIYGIEVSARTKAEEFGVGKCIINFYSEYSVRKIFLDKYPQQTFRVYIF